MANTAFAPGLLTLHEDITARASINDDTRRYADFRHKYFKQPAQFVLDCIDWDEGEGPCSYQLELLQWVADESKVSWRGPRGARKTSTVAWAVLWFALTRDGNPRRDWKVGMTASVGRQLEDFLWPEIHSWRQRLRWDIIGREPFKENAEWMTQKIRLKNGMIYSFVSNDPDKIEGAHAPEMMFVFDEAKAIPEASFDAVMGGTTGAGEGTTQRLKAIAVSTPGPPIGWFYDIHQGKYAAWKHRHITQQECIEAGALSEVALKELEVKYGGKNTTLYQQQCEGNFAADDINGIIPLAWIEAAIERGKEWRRLDKPGLMNALGVDVGDGGANATVLAPCYGNQVDELEVIRSDKSLNDGVSQTMAETGRVVNFLNANDKGKPVAVVDANAAGAGMCSALKQHIERKKELRQPVLWTVDSFIAQSKVDKTLKIYGEETPGNRRAAGFMLMAWLLDPMNEQNVGLPDDNQLKIELLCIHRKPLDSAGRVFIESKEDIAARLHGMSTDRADAVMQGLSARWLKKKVSRYWVL